MKKEYLKPNLEIEVIECKDICLISELFGNKLEVDEAQGGWIW